MASDLNAVVIVGRLTRDAELKYSASGTAISRFSIANTQSRKKGDQWVEEGHFFDAILFGRRADALQRYLVKGKQVAVQGSLQQNRWQDKQTGQNRSRVEIMVNDIQLIGSSGGGGGYAGPSSEGESSAPPANQSDYHSGSSDDSSFDDDIPF